MAYEIERKYLIDPAKWNIADRQNGKFIRQGYLVTSENKTVRVRLVGDNAFLTVKGKTIGSVRSEFEYEIPVQDALELLNTLCESELSKTRYEVNYSEKIWEIDVFHGLNEGLIVAEIELEHENEEFDLPAWIAEEVTGKPEYYNSSLTIMPYQTWQK